MRARAPSGGFTLIETILVLAIVALLSGSVMGFLSGVSERRRAMEHTARDEEGAAVVAEQLEASLLCAAAGGSGLGPGVKGDETSVRVLSMGVRVPGAADRGRGFGAARVVEFAFDAGVGVVRGRRWSPGETVPEMETVVERVRRVRFRYHGGEAWAGSFDSVARNSLPAAVEVAIWFGGPKPAEETGELSAEPAAESAPDHVRLIVVADGPVGGAKGDVP